MSSPQRTPRAGSEVYARSPVPLGNGTFGPDGRLVVSHHPMCETPERVSVFTGPTTLAPFPNAAWNTPREGSDDWLDAVLGLRTDTRGRVWLLDMGTRSNVTPKFVVWDCRADALARVLRLPRSVLTPHSESNDFVLDERRGAAYVADEGAGNGGDGSTAATWLWEQWINVLRMRSDGVPVLGFTWYSLTDQVDWDIQLREVRGRVNPCGLYDLDRKPRPVAAAFRALLEEFGQITIVPHGEMFEVTDREARLKVEV